MLLDRRQLIHVDCDPGIPAAKLTEHGREQTRDDRFVSADPDFARRRVGEEIDFLYALAKIVEYSDAAVEQRTAVFRRLDPLRTAVEQAHAQGVLEVRDGSRNGRLRRVQLRCRLAHAAALDHGHQNMQVVELEAASDPVGPAHGSPLLKSDMG
ncbi:MAG TPA: hypothetical protein VHD14_17855 [Pseudolabrys sp.]|nr:hypothetical protein [Pseudolabrys sp.]